MMARPIQVGIIGCGEIAQLVHLPFLDELSEFSITAVCDLSPLLSSTMQQRYRVPASYSDGADLIADPQVDAVVLCTSDHADLAMAALRAGKHLLIEKPVAFTPAEGDRIADTARASRGVAMVGYMKLFDPALEELVRILPTAGNPRSKTVQDFAGRLDRYEEMYGLIRGTDIAEEVLTNGRRAVDARVREHLGSQQEWSSLYLLLLGLASHDLAVLRTVFGTPTGVSWAQASDDRGLVAVLDYPDGVPCVFRIGIGTNYEWWDEWLSFDTDDGSIRIDFGHPYIKYAPTTVSTHDSRDGHDCRTVDVMSQASPFKLELEHFAAAIRGDTPVRTPVVDAVADLRLASDIIRALPERRWGDVS